MDLRVDWKDYGLPVGEYRAALLADKIAEVQARIAELTTFGEQLAGARESLGRQTPEGACDESCGCLSDPDGATQSTQSPRVLQLTPARPKRVPPRSP